MPSPQIDDDDPYFPRDVFTTNLALNKSTWGWWKRGGWWKEKDLPKANILVLADRTAAWEMCWQHVPSLPRQDLSDEALFAEAERLVRSCHARAGDQGIAWFREELDDGQLFIAEQLVADPDDPDWQRVSVMLAGAEAGLKLIKDQPD